MRQIYRKFFKLISLIKYLDIIKSVIWMIRLRIFNSLSLCIYPSSIVDISKTANVIINEGRLVINASWFNVRSRRYTSELRICGGGKLIVNGLFSLYQGASIHIAENAEMVCGNNSYINTNSTINCFKSIKIGNNCAISDNVSIHDSDSHMINNEKENVIQAVIIEDGVWIGKNVIILKGVTIGEGAIIGAGSVVTKSIPAHCLAVGNPAKVIRENVTWSDL